MAATTGLTLLVLLLYCGQGADLPPINMSSGTATTTNKTNVQEDMPGVFDSSIHESDQLSVPEGFHKLADLSPISLETEDKILNEPSLDASYRTSGPEDYRDSQTSGTADSLHSNGKKHPKTDQQLKQSVLDMILQNIGKSSGKVNNGVVTRGVVPLGRREALSQLRGPSGAVSSSGEEPTS
ncbi:PREDICTED: sperm acrosome-associated protein 7 [Capra hircus]|uniref:sperm acrosome-associated protein 7 n=1 Tax=Capra hircus TaxID=9925 RepID=UPI000846A745|nr:PREDICTED: sperm acrosome-associated protein 7 [Capra hircus]